MQDFPVYQETLLQASLTNLSVDAPSSLAEIQTLRVPSTGSSIPQVLGAQPPKDLSRFQPINHQNDSQAVLMGTLTVLIPLGLLMSILAYRRLRATTLQRRVAALEKLWQLNCRKEI